MFPLYSKTFPSNAAELERLLNASVERVFTGVSGAVTVRDKAFPTLEGIRIQLDGAELRGEQPAPPKPQGTVSPALTLESLQIEGFGITAGPVALDLKLNARDIRLSQARDAKDEIILTLQSAANGAVEISALTTALESAIAEVAKREAAKHGVAIDEVQLTLRSRGVRGLDAEVRLRAQKLFFTTVIEVAARLDLDEQLNATLSGLRCQGEGTIGSLACGFLTPHLQKLDGRSFALMALPLGEIRLRDVRLSAVDRLTVNAEFGA